MPNRKHIGTTSEEGINEVERGAIRRFAEAIGDDNPLHHDPAFARRAGYRDVVAPPTFPATFRAGSDLYAAIGALDPRLLHGEQTFEYARPIVAGDRVTVVERVADITEHDGGAGPVTLLVVEAEGTGDEGEPLYWERRLLIVRSA